MYFYSIKNTLFIWRFEEALKDEIKLDRQRARNTIGL